MYMNQLFAPSSIWQEFISLETPWMKIFGKNPSPTIFPFLNSDQTLCVVPVSCILLIKGCGDHYRVIWNFNYASLLCWDLTVYHLVTWLNSSTWPSITRSLIATHWDRFIVDQFWTAHRTASRAHWPAPLDETHYISKLAVLCLTSSFPPLPSLW